ncbi:MAG: hypothetical protein ACREFZ_04400, partial [Acetobacteraceae bacterium]
MRLSTTLCVATALALGTAGIANATPLVENGDFSLISTATGVNPRTPTQINYGSYGEFVEDWTTTGPLLSQNVVWFPGAKAASGTNALDIDTIFPFGPRALLPGTVTAPPDGGAFLGMQSNMPSSGVQQSITGLTA